VGKKLVALSIDSLHGDDFERGERYMPVLSALMRAGTTVEQVESVYPTITYAAHASMMTGCLPKKTRVVANELLEPGAKYPAWHWWARDNCATPLYQLAQEAGFRVGMAHWPVTAGAKVTVNMAEIWPDTPMGDCGQTYAEAGCNPRREREIFQRHRLFHSFRYHPPFDMFAHAAARDMLSEDGVDALFVHSAYLDAAHHLEGNGGDRALEAMAREDAWLGGLLDQVARNGDAENTLIAVLSDHGSIDYTRVFCPNALLIGRGFAAPEPEGIGDVRAWAFSGGGAILIHVRDASDEPAVLALLRDAARDERYGIDSVLPAEEALGFRPDDAAFVIEMREGWAASPECGQGALYQCPVRATHGYLPRKGPQPLAVFAGPGVAAGRRIARAHLCDLAPTMAQWLGIGMPDADGSPIGIWA